MHSQKPYVLEVHRPSKGRGGPKSKVFYMSSAIIPFLFICVACLFIGMNFQDLRLTVVILGQIDNLKYHIFFINDLNEERGNNNSNTIVFLSLRPIKTCIC